MTEVQITSTANPRVKATARLRDRRERDRRGLTIVDGGREVGRAIDAGVEIVEAWVCPALVRTDDARRALTRLEQSGAPVVTVIEPAFERIAFGERADGVVAVVRPPSTALVDLVLPAEPLVVVLDGVEKPGNVGAILRTADGAGADGLVMTNPGTDLFNPNTIRASVGAIFSVPAAAAPPADVRRWLAEAGIRPVAARVDGRSAPWEADLRGAVAVVLGSEASGLGSAWADDDVTAVRIPMAGLADSLNVSVAAGVLLYEARRQRDRGDGQSTAPGPGHRNAAAGGRTRA